MLELLFCANNISCSLRTSGEIINGAKYPQDVAQLCYYFEEQKSELPEYCKWKSETFKPRRRSEF
jgi:hypothetical protein